MSATLAQELSAAMAAIHRRGWCDGTGGNFSCVKQRQPLQLLMAPSGVDKGSVAPEALIVVDVEGKVVQGSGKASAETALHLAIVRCCNAGAVLHTHSQAGTLLSRLALNTTDTQTEQGTGSIQLEGLEMLKGLEGIRSHDTQVSLPVLANDQDLNRLSERAEPQIRSAP